MMKVAGVALLAVMMSGCVVKIGDNYQDEETWRKTQKYNQQQINQLQLDTDIAHIRTLLGTPDFSETFNKEGETIQVLFYRTHHVKSDGKTTKDECTALIFKQNRLSGWGEKAYQYL